MIAAQCAAALAALALRCAQRLWCVRIVPHCCAFVFSVHERRHSSLALRCHRELLVERQI
jgi:hypothetical protein